jgi:hypothetical protein
MLNRRPGLEVPDHIVGRDVRCRQEDLCSQQLAAALPRQPLPVQGDVPLWVNRVIGSRRRQPNVEIKADKIIRSARILVAHSATEEQSNGKRE